MAKALYHNEILEAKPYDILAKNADGTVDIGTGKTVVVKSCQIASEPKIGCVVLVEEAPAKPKDK